MMKQKILPLLFSSLLLFSCATPENIADEKIFQDKVIAHKTNGSVNYSFKTLNDDTYKDSNHGTFTYYEFKTNKDSVGTCLDGLWFCVNSTEVIDLYFSVIISPLDYDFKSYIDNLLKKDDKESTEDDKNNDEHNDNLHTSEDKNSEETKQSIVRSDILHVQTYENDLIDTSILFEYYIKEPVKIILTISDDEQKIINPLADYEIGLCEFYFSCYKGEF